MTFLMGSLERMTSQRGMGDSWNRFTKRLWFKQQVRVISQLNQDKLKPYVMY